VRVEAWCRENDGIVSKISPVTYGKMNIFQAKKSDKKCLLPLRGKNREFAGVHALRAVGSYPLFLWITLCIRVRKHAISERIRGLRPN
ncbi:hypothetical protein, partial [Enterobacter hormaechei]|uniref:hypothetical protein n=1 Tax=Enterobacter hormaechei TaxID=158836 RepID=UPI001C3F0C05